MRIPPWILVALLAASPALAPPASAAGENSNQIACSQIPEAQHFIDGLRPGPNTRAAQRHLDAAKAAGSEQHCVAELRQVDHYARRSADADRHATNVSAHTVHHQRQVLCADPLHQNRPGGSDYHGPSVPGCPRVP